MIEPELTLLQMQVKGRTAHPLELDEPRFSDAPEAFDAVDVAVTSHEFVTVMMNSVMLLIPHVHDAIVRAKAITRRQSARLSAIT